MESVFFSPDVNLSYVELRQLIKWFIDYHQFW